LANELRGLDFISGAQSAPNAAFLTCGSIEERMAKDNAPTTTTLAQRGFECAHTLFNVVLKATRQASRTTLNNIFGG
jgi:hypothetical protein